MAIRRAGLALAMVAAIALPACETVQTTQSGAVGVERKQALLDLEGRVAAGLPPEPAWEFRQLALL